MRFGAVPIAEAEGAILAHSLAEGGLRLKKGRRLAAADVTALAAAGVAEVVVARLEAGDIGEDAAAEAVARALAPEPGRLRLAVSAPFTGRVNLFAEAAGLLRVDRAAVDALNAVDPAITLATLPDWSRVAPRQMVATVKIIPYGVATRAVDAAVAAIRTEALRVAAFRPGTASLILTRTPGLKESLVAKGRETISTRLAALDQTLAEPPFVVAHTRDAVARALSEAAGEMLLILGGSATSDAADVCPAGVIAAGGEIERFGMPVDPGNLLFIGRLGARPVVGLPGCIRTPALNGADWVLERLAAGLAVNGADIAAMGVGGLLKEIPTRVQPRAGAVPGPVPARPRVAVIVLAAGAARRMRGRDKLLEPLGDGRPVLRHAAEAALASQASEVVVVLPPGAEGRREALGGTGARVVEAPDWAEGMAASLRAGLAAVAPETDAVVVLLADMPEVRSRDIDRLIAAFDPAEGREICRAVTADGVAGHPVLFGRRFFETLGALSGDRGARDVLREGSEFVTDVPTPGRSAVVDLDTPEDWESWRRGLQIPAAVGPT
jgi:molybdenum cofactor cytidylyltransferase